MGEIVEMKSKEEVNIIKYVFTTLVTGVPEEIIDQISCLTTCVYPDRMTLVIDGKDGSKEETDIPIDEVLKLIDILAGIGENVEE